MIDRFDSWLSGTGPVALVIRESLQPVTGAGTVFFPPTFAASEDAPKGTKADYVIDGDVCLVDSVGSQGNRLEPMFKSEPLSSLVPQVTVTVGERRLNLLELGHRAADAVARFSGLGPDLNRAFLDYRERGDATALAKIAPTSLVFGVWDSRDTGAKVPRLVESTVRAYGVERLSRSAQYFAALNDAERKEIDAGSEEGLVDTPSGRVHGGVIAKDGIRRDAVLNLVALRALNGPDGMKLRRYILGLALVAFVVPAESYLRQGCLLVCDPEKPSETRAVYRDGKREAVTLTADDAIAFAKAAAAEFGKGEDRVEPFDKDAAKAKKEKTKKGK